MKPTRPRPTPQDRLDGLAIRLSRHIGVDGLWVGILGTTADDATLGKVEAALLLIKRYDPARYNRLRRRLPRIWLCPLIGANGAYSLATGLCKLDVKYVQSAPPEEIASTIVHESTHAHPCLQKFGYAEKVRYRIEMLCMRQELAFVRLLPASETMQTELHRRLQAPAMIWSDDLREELQPALATNAARSYGLPEWVIKFLLFLRRK
jgi:hypothetical protein